MQAAAHSSLTLIYSRGILARSSIKAFRIALSVFSILKSIISSHTCRF